jgi:hypothetical protein
MIGAFSASIIDPDVEIGNYVVTSIGNSGKIGTATFAVNTPSPQSFTLSAILLYQQLQSWPATF